MLRVSLYVNLLRAQQGSAELYFNAMVGGGGPGDFSDSLSPKNWIWNFGLLFLTQTLDST